MAKKIFVGVFCGFAFVAQTRAQEVIVPRESISEDSELQVSLAQEVRKAVRIEQPTAAAAAKARPPIAPVEQQDRVTSLVGSADPRREQTIAPSSANTPLRKQEAISVRPLTKPIHEPESIPAQPVSVRTQTAFIKLANGFDFPVGKPDAQGYYKAQGFRSRSHLGEDWDGVGGGDTDLGDPIYSIGDGVVVFARDCQMGWGNVVIVRHAYREGVTIKNIDSLYGHLQRMLVHRGQTVRRGQQIATMGNVHGLYDAHLHLEIRKNIEIGMSRDKFAQDLNNYYEPSQFILAHRHLQSSGGTYRVALNTFTRDANIRWDKARNFSRLHYQGGSSESEAALKKALVVQNASAH